MSWTPARLKHVARFGYGDALPPDEPQDGEFRVFGSNGPFSSFGRANTLGPAIIVGRKGSYGKVNWSSEPCFASDTTFFVDASTTTCPLRWIYWLLQTLRLDEGTDEAAIPGLNRETAYSRQVLIPPESTQQAIGRFLDRETGRIDALVAAKQRVLDLLTEKRKAIIASAVTRGIDPRAKLRDSGVPWLGEIPAHWTTPPIYARYQVQLGKMLDERRITKRFLAPYLRNIDIQWEAVNVEDLPEMDFDESEQEAYALRPGDILMCEGGEIGRCAIWNSDRRCFYQKALHRLRPITERDDPRYFVLVMRAAVEAGLFESQASAATIQHLPAEKLRIVRYAAPPIDEQRAIVANIARETAKLDDVRAATERTIALLKERRAALIAAAVTGQTHVEATE